jgi:hypothetical protein
MFTAYNEATETWRIDRLKLVWASVCAFIAAGQGSLSDLLGGVASLHDHKGVLQVEYFSEEKKDQFQRMFMEA